MMDRKQAQQELAGLQGTLATAEQRAAMIMNWWSLSKDDPEWLDLPEGLRTEIQGADSPEHPATNHRYDALVRLHLLDRMRGVTNRWLADQLTAARGVTVEVEGEIESMECCPCCGYLSLRRRHEWEVCPVCFWEDDSTDESALSGANRMTLREARQNYALFGAYSQAAIGSVVSDRRYPRGA